MNLLRKIKLWFVVFLERVKNLHPTRTPRGGGHCLLGTSFCAHSLFCESVDPRPPKPADIGRSETSIPPHHVAPQIMHLGVLFLGSIFSPNKNTLLKVSFYIFPPILHSFDFYCTLILPQFLLYNHFCQIYTVSQSN